MIDNQAILSMQNTAIMHGDAIRRLDANASAILEIKASNKGLLIPRTSTATRAAIVNPAKGLIIYDTTTSSFWFNNGVSWKEISVGSNGWKIFRN